MSEQVLRIRAVDSLLFRDGRPFGAEIGSQFAQTLPCPYPSTVAGFIRTLAGNRWGLDWAEESTIQQVLGIPVQGPLLERNGETVFRAPADAVVFEQAGGRARVAALRPIEPAQGEGCDLPDGVLPLMPDTAVEGKPPKGYDLWRCQTLSRWLSDPSAAVPEQVEGMEVEERVHVAIDDEKGTSQESLLFSVQFLCFERYRWGEAERREEWSLLVRVSSEQPLPLEGVGLLGGEKRIATVEPVEAQRWPSCPPDVYEALGRTEKVRLVLATPAIFSGGWKPGWLGDNLQGSPPSAPDLKLQLVSAAVRRREAVSGWDYRKDRQGPKPVRWLAPAGSVYFFRVIGGDPLVLAEDGWLQSVCDDPQHRRDGYGLALWGIW